MRQRSSANDFLGLFGIQPKDEHNASVWNRSQPCDPVGLVQITKTPESRKYEKITKKIQNPPFRVGARKYEKNTEKKQNGPKITIFVFFRYFFLYFRAPTREGGFCMFFCYFFVFSGFRDFCNLYQARRVAKPARFE